MTLNRMSIWWITASERSEGGWHWNNFFAYKGGSHGWGGKDWIKSTSSHRCIRRMKKGDILVAYQTKQGLLGMVTLNSNGYQENTGDPFNMFDISSSPRLMFKQEIPLRAIQLLPHSKPNFGFLNSPMGTAFEVHQKGFDRLLGLVLAYNPTQAKQLAAFLRKTRAKVPYRLSR